MGPPDAGKSIYGLQHGYSVVAKTGGKILVLKTEESSDYLIDMWAPKFQTAYGVKEAPITRFFKNAQELMAYCGQKGTITIGDKNEFKPSEINVSKSDFVKDIKDNEITYVMIDSITTPFNVLAAGGRQNLPLRAQCEELFFGALNATIVDNKIRLFTTNHISLNPTNPYQSREQIALKGGKIIEHYTKILFYLEPRTKPHGYRKLWVVRYGDVAGWSTAYDLLIEKEAGYRATSDDEIAKLKDAAKAK
jgi:hypothetical protein